MVRSQSSLVSEPAEPAGGDVEVSVLMPCLNEAETIEVCIRKALRWFARAGVRGEVVVADNGSTDGSIEIARAAGARVVPIPMRGYGSALRGGIEAARGRFVIMGDADDSYDFSALDAHIEKLRHGYDLVMGNRFAGGIRPGAMPPLHRYLGNPVLSWLGRLFFKSPVRDFHCGLRGFSRTAVLGLDLRTTGMEFASELVVKATLFGLKITEVPTSLSPDGRSRPPHLRSWRDGWRHLRFLLLYSPRWLFLYPGLSLMGLGLGGMAVLLPGPLTVGGLTLDINTMAFAGSAVLVGFQAVTFAVFSRIFAFTDGLLPADPSLARLFEYVTLEVGLGAGVALVGLGTGLAVVLVRAWSAGGFGPLDATETLRLAIPAGVLMALGAQVIFGSFFLSLLGVRRS
jgi:hypothetical protein